MRRLTPSEQLSAFYKRLHLRHLKNVLCSAYLLICLVLVILLIGFMLISGRAASFSVFAESAELLIGDSDVAEAVFLVFVDFQSKVTRALNISMFYFLVMTALSFLILFASLHYLPIIIDTTSRRIWPKSKALSKLLLEMSEGSEFRLLGMFRFIKPFVLGLFVVITLFAAWKYQNDMDSYFMFAWHFGSTSIVILCLIFCLFDAYTGRLAQVVKMMKQKRLPKRQRIAYFAEGYVHIIVLAVFLYIAILLLSSGAEAVWSKGVSTVDDRINKLVEAYAMRLSEAGGYQTERATQLLKLALQPYRQGRLWILELMNRVVFFLGKFRSLVVPLIAITGIYYVALPLYRLEVNRPIGFMLISLCTMLVATFLIESCLPSVLAFIKEPVLAKIGWMTITFITLLLADRIGKKYFSGE